MSDVKRLLEAATPLPWEAGTGHLAPTTQARHTALRMVGHPVEDSLHSWQLVARGRTAADAALIVYAVNRLPDYETAVDALERLLTEAELLDDEAWDSAVAALARLRWVPS